MMCRDCIIGGLVAALATYLFLRSVFWLVAIVDAGRPKPVQDESADDESIEIIPLVEVDDDTGEWFADGTKRGD